jgi:hypothetical protein
MLRFLSFGAPALLYFTDRRQSKQGFNQALCIGIVGYLGPRSSIDVTVDGISRLQGYGNDS